MVSVTLVPQMDCLLLTQLVLPAIPSAANVLVLQQHNAQLATQGLTYTTTTLLVANA